MKKAIIVLSGGMDSGVLLADYSRKYKMVGALFFNYGSKHNSNELACAIELAEIYKVKLEIVELPFINQLFNSSLLSSSDEEIPEGHYEEENMKSTVVPFRNGIMLAIATGYAESLEADVVMLGSHSGDHAIYPDCRPEFNQAFADAAKFGTYQEVQILAPYANISKIGIAEIGHSIDFPFEKTWTCYKGLEQQCGKCGSCVERKEALSFNGQTDPTKYLD